MTTFLLVVLLLHCAALLLWGLAGRGRIYEFPFLAGAVILGWATPQIVGLANAGTVPSDAINKITIMTVLTAAACWFGYTLPSQPKEKIPSPMLVNRLIFSSIVLSLIGVFFFYKISTLPENIRNVTQGTGIITVYFFFSQLMSYGFIIAIIVYISCQRTAALFVCLFDATFYLHRIIIAGRRSVMVEFVAAIALAFWFHRRAVPPRVLVLAGIVFGALFIGTVGEYREATMHRDGPRWSAAMNIDMLESFEQIINGRADELDNAALIIAATEARRTFDFGAFNWNAFVFAYVPAQFVGSSIKNALYIDLGFGNPMYDEFFHTPLTGTTATGMADAFGSFWYFGAIKFFIIALIMRNIYLSAMRGNINQQIFYIALLTPSLHSITHHTQWFFNAWIHMAFFLLPVLWLCRAPADAGHLHTYPYGNRPLLGAAS